MFAVLIALHVIACLVLIAVILLQAGKGGGLAETFGGSGGFQSIFGTKTSAFLTRATAISAVLFLATSLTLTLLSMRRGESLLKHEAVTETKTLPAPTAEKPSAVPPTAPSAADVKPQEGK